MDRAKNIQRVMSVQSMHATNYVGTDQLRAVAHSREIARLFAMQAMPTMLHRVPLLRHQRVQ